MGIERAIAEFALTAHPPMPARHMMRLSLLDWAACALAGQGEDVSRIVREMVTTEGGARQASLIGGGQVPVRAAALANGTTSHALDYDDTHFAHIGHPSVAVIPAALAVAESTGADGAEFLDAALIGAEASVRIGIWLGRSHYQAGFHQTATAGVFGATLAAARLLRLNEGQTTHALGQASTRAAGLKTQFGTMGKPFHAGLAASGGVQSALLAQAGFQSDPNGLSGPNGFAATHVGEADMSGLKGLGEHWQMESVSHKFHACCHGLHAMLEALNSISRDFAAENVATVQITAHPRWQNVCNQISPTTGLGAKFSFRHVAAMALAGVDTAAMNSFSDEMANRPELCALGNRVEVGFDEVFAETASRVVVNLKNQTQIAAGHDIADALPVAERQDRLLAKAQSLLGPETAKNLWGTVENGPDLGVLTAILREPIRA